MVGTGMGISNRPNAAVYELSKMSPDPRLAPCLVSAKSPATCAGVAFT